MSVLLAAPGRAQSSCADGGSSAAIVALRPGDVVRLKVWREPDLSGDFAVDETGRVVLPRLGARAVTDVPMDRVRADLLNAYLPFLSHSAVEVTLLRRIQVLGAVRNPGLYPVDATMTVDDALALAGGVTVQGHPDRVRLIHQGALVCSEVSKRTLIGGSLLRSGDQLFVPERSWVSRNPGVVAGIATAAATLVITLLR